MANDLKIKIKVDKNTGELIVAQKEFTKLGSAIQKASKDVTTFGQKIKTSTDFMAHSAQAIVGWKQIITGVFSTVTDAIKPFVETSMQFEKFETVLKTIEGSSTKAKESMKWIEVFASKTPYQLEQVTDSFVKLKAYGIDPTDGTLKTLGNTASAMGKNINQAVEAMADAVTGENERLKEFGIKASKQGEQIAYAWADSSGKTKHIIIENNREIIQSTLESIFNSRYAGAMEEQSKTLNGMLSNMQDNYTKFQKNIMDGGLYNYFKAIAAEVNKRFLETFDKTVNAGKLWANKFIDAINSIIKAFGFMSDAITGIKLVINAIKLAFLGVVKYFTEAINTPIKLLNYAIKAYNELASMVGKDGIDFKFNDVINTNGIDKEISQTITTMQSQVDELINQTGVKFADKFIADVSDRFKKFSTIADDTKKKIIEVKGAMDGGFKGFNASEGKKEDGNYDDYLSRQLADQTDQVKEQVKQINEALELIKSPAEKVNEEFMAIHDVIKDVFNPEQLEKFYKVWQEQAEGVNKQAEKYEGIGSKDWTAGLEGSAKQIANISNAFADLGKEQEAWNKFNKDNVATDEDKNKHLQNQLGLYGNIAGAVVNMAEEGSAAAKVAQVAQTALAIANGVSAILNQGNGDPYTAFARIAAMTALVASTLSSFGIGGGGSGGGGSASPYSASEMANMAITELQDQAVVDRLDQQIELLEAIEKNGSAQALSVDLARAEFTQSLNEWVQDVFDMSMMGFVGGNITAQHGSDIDSYYTSQGMVSPYLYSNGKIAINSSLLRSNPEELIKIMADMSEFTRGVGFDYTGPFGQALAKELGYGEEAHQAFLAQIKSTFTELQGYLNDWAISVVDSVSEIKSAADDMKGMYDDITGTNFFANQKLTQAFKDFDSLLSGGQSYADYLLKNINSIEESTKFIYELSGVLDENGRELSNYELLLSKNGDLIEEQIAKVDEFGAVVGTVFENGVEEALNYIDAIELVAEAMAKSRENIESFIGSYRTSFDNLAIMATEFNVPISKTDEALKSVFEELQGGLGGLTDEELEFLNLNKEYIAYLNESVDVLDDRNDALEAENALLSELTANISQLESVLGSISTAIDTLSGAALGSQYNLDKFRTAIAQSMSLAQSGSFGEEYITAVGTATSNVSALTNTENFTSARDMQFAQLTALNQFESLKDITLTEVDYLKQIEINTRNTVAALSGQIANLSTSIDQWKPSTPANNPFYGEDAPIDSTINEVIKAFETSLGKTPDVNAEGFKWWVNELINNPNITSENLVESVARGASTKDDVYAAASWMYRTDGDQGGIGLLDRAYREGYLNDQEANTLFDRYAVPDYALPDYFVENYDYNKFKSLIKPEAIVPFADGGIVTRPVNALIGEAGYPEAVIPLKNPNDPLQMQGLIKEIRALKDEVKTLTAITEVQAQHIRDMDDREERIYRETA